jgi:hypothetical protein
MRGFGRGARPSRGVARGARPRPRALPSHWGACGVACVVAAAVDQGERGHGPDGHPARPGTRRLGRPALAWAGACPFGEGGRGVVAGPHGGGTVLRQRRRRPAIGSALRKMDRRLQVEGARRGWGRRGKGPAPRGRRARARARAPGRAPGRGAAGKMGPVPARPRRPVHPCKVRCGTMRLLVCARACGSRRPGQARRQGRCKSGAPRPAGAPGRRRPKRAWRGTRAEAGSRVVPALAPKLCFRPKSAIPELSAARA